MEMLGSARSEGDLRGLYVTQFPVTTTRHPMGLKKKKKNDDDDDDDVNKT